MVVKVVEMEMEENNSSDLGSNNLVKKDQKALADAYIEFRSSRAYELKRSKFKGSLRLTKTDRIVFNNEICKYINLDAICETKLDRSQSLDESSQLDKSPGLADKQESNISKIAIFEHIVAVMVVTALFFLMQHVLGDLAALVTAFMVVVGYFAYNINIAIK